MLKPFDGEKLYNELKERYNVDFADLFIKNNFKIFLFGGSLRDVLVGKDWKDADIRVLIQLPQNEREEKAEVLLKEAGIDVKDTKTRFGDQLTVYRFLPKGSISEYVIDFGVADDESAAPPDFTVNSLFFDLESKELIDRFGAVEDIKNNIIRSIGDPEQKFKEDPVRIFRVIKAVCQFGFDIDSETFRAMKNNVGNTENLFEIIADKKSPTFTEWFLSNVFRSFKYNAAKSKELWDEVGITKVFINFVSKRLNLSPKTYTIEDVFENNEHIGYEESLSIFLGATARAVNLADPEKSFKEIVELFHITEPDRYGDFVIDISKIFYR
jgi:tRNA nucleotidyltransferase/poly(A) polymerase